ncbi:MAG: hypothetical protein COB12_11530 [Flavobacterium sp.]|nr:MAG: hypothetical protein COB12_11530 [Flavobacterium sp.]
MFTRDASGDTSTTTQVIFNGVSYLGIGVQNTCNPDGTTTTCNIVSGDGIDKEGFLVNGVPVMWSGRHTFNNEASGANNCSEVLGFWKRGNMFGGFKQDPAFDCPPATVNLYQEIFTTFTGAGFTPNPTAGQLDSDVIIVSGFSNGSLNYGDSGTSGDFSRGQNDGGVGTGGIYAFEVIPGEFALGVQPGGSDFTPGFIEIKTTNTTGNNLGAFDISYDIYVYNDQNRTNSFSFSYSTDGINYIDVTDLDFASLSTADGTPIWVKTTKTATFYGEVPDSGNLYLRFTGDDVSGSGSRDEFAINNFSITQAE